jgi:drug/metabolite transporter (DMT)-like permease
MIRGRALSIVLLLLTMLIWGSTYVVTKAGLEEMPPLLFALLRFFVASLVLAPLALLRGGVARLPPPLAWPTVFFMALTGVGLYQVGFNVALMYTTASQGALVQSSIPAITALMAIVWLHERVSRQRLLGIGLAVAGVILIVTRATPGAGARAPLVGNLLMFGTVLVWGVYTMLAKRTAGADALAVMASVAVLGTLILVPAAVIEVARVPTPSISATSWLRIVYLGALPSAAGYLFYSRALRDLDASQVGTFINLVPVVGVLSGVVFLGERITASAILGGALVLAGVWISSRGGPARDAGGKAGHG